MRTFECKNLTETCLRRP